MRLPLSHFARNDGMPGFGRLFRDTVRTSRTLILIFAVLGFVVHMGWGSGFLAFGVILGSLPGFVVVDETTKRRRIGSSLFGFAAILIMMFASFLFVSAVGRTDPLIDWTLSEFCFVLSLALFVPLIVRVYFVVTTECRTAGFIPYLVPVLLFAMLRWVLAIAILVVPSFIGILHRPILNEFTWATLVRILADGSLDAVTFVFFVVAALHNLKPLAVEPEGSSNVSEMKGTR
ncbi:hypothetical protein [uncultured Jannaschia sp.]|uniref:hypothetical protein n=1 Tax=uncultured Jannaschia sp. TaxID=293347 RepID=UPI002611F406|nr:hypothetical protein [uncultured Jannaschia sp.]